MRRRLVFVALAVVAFMSVVAVRPHHTFADERDFTHVYVSAADVDDWQEDILGRGVLVPGDTVNIHFSKFDSDSGKCCYDICGDGDSGERGLLTKVNLCSTDTVTFS
jgi:hypothetical protein